MLRCLNTLPINDADISKKGREDQDIHKLLEYDGAKMKAGAPRRRRGIEDLRTHDLRHTAAAWLVQDDVPRRTVCELLRHKDIATTMHDAHPAPGCYDLVTVTKKDRKEGTLSA